MGKPLPLPYQYALLQCTDTVVWAKGMTHGLYRITLQQSPELSFFVISSLPVAGSYTLVGHAVALMLMTWHFITYSKEVLLAAVGPIANLKGHYF